MFPVCGCQTNTTQWTNVGLVLAQHRRWWVNIKPSLGTCVMFVWRGLHLRVLYIWLMSRLLYMFSIDKNVYHQPWGSSFECKHFMPFTSAGSNQFLMFFLKPAKYAKKYRLRFVKWLDWHVCIALKLCIIIAYIIILIILHFYYCIVIILSSLNNSTCFDKRTRYFRLHTDIAQIQKWKKTCELQIKTFSPFILIIFS